MIEGNGKNRFWIEVKCPLEVVDAEWLELLVIINRLLAVHHGGKYNNVGAYLCEEGN